jgi:hypothetical protein
MDACQAVRDRINAYIAKQNGSKLLQSQSQADAPQETS